MKGNWLNENQKQIEYYMSSRDIILIERKRQLQILLQVFESVFEKKENLKFLDLGCGDGIISKIIYNLYPNNTYHLLDGSDKMLEKAKLNFPHENFIFTNSTFENFISENKEENKYDFIYSSMAIHHLEHHNKFKLYSKLYTCLKNTGLLLNIDTVLPSSKGTEEIQFTMWKKYIIEELEKTGNQADIKKHEDLPLVYKRNLENTPSTLVSQLSMLEQIGYYDIECYFKYSVFAIFGGRKI